MINKLNELMKLSNAVDIICKAANEENIRKDKVLKGKLADQWIGMWNDIDTILPILEVFRPKANHIHIGPYKYGYPYGFNYLHENGITFIVSSIGRIEVMMDKGGGWEEITRDMDVFDYWMRCHRPCVEMLLDKWNEVFENIQSDMEKRLAKNIKERINACKNETVELDRKLARYE